MTRSNSRSSPCNGSVVHGFRCGPARRAARTAWAMLTALRNTADAACLSGFRVVSGTRWLDSTRLRSTRARLQLGASMHHPRCRSGVMRKLGCYRKRVTSRGQGRRITLERHPLRSELHKPNWLATRPIDMGSVLQDLAPYWSWTPRWQEAT